MEYTDVINFNKKNYPKRKNIGDERYLNWRIDSNPFKSSDFQCFYYVNDELAGQIIPIYTKAYFNHLSFNCVWGSDFFVDPNYRNSSVAVILLKNILKNHIHFGVGMSSISESMHLAFKEIILGFRTDGYFLRLKKIFANTSNNISLLNYDQFIEFIFNNQDKYLENKDLIHFDRSKTYFDWILRYAEKENLFFLCDSFTCNYLIVYKIKKYGFCLNWIIDHSYDLSNEEIESFLNRLPGISPITFNYYSGTNLSFNNYTICKFKRRNIVTNLFNKKEEIGLTPSIKIHITSLDSDRFINYFL